MYIITHPGLPTSTPKLSTKISASRASPVAQGLKNPPANGGDMAGPLVWKTAHSVEQGSPCTTTTEPVL